MSSFQLERTPTLAPDVAVILNVTPDHLDRYDSFAAYRSAKLNITRNQTEHDTIIYNLDDPELEHFETDAAKIGFSTVPGKSDAAFHWDGTSIRYSTAKVIEYTDCALRGPHNLANILAGLNAVEPFISPDSSEEILRHFRQVLRTFSGIVHRLEFVKQVNDVSYYNDSKATNVDAVKFAIESFEEPVILILGGYDKNGDFPQLIPSIRKHVKQTVAIGKARTTIQGALSPAVDVVTSDNLETAMGAIQEIAEPGDVVLLSPACASFDQYENYEKRGEHFKQLVEALN
ncbi:MAG: UDP-N-acetylmuramoyl-L-alanine--D-glutamate ligase [Candidatus Marinimicrobia bacterium]|nr:UDP-N-acetylmuramoyl-L-alanine--D-glutamate ligase [Candidatus Neomarinimicrobiota bacterium]MCF7829624.1 UDP-N-acetylmuramoyl-L-alanine--D-glutamate ligase [Candidatus Neomarinimicrobiota bacterium]MCF7879784.1 UDP-N-acetylmuramoyl-L-alanine--D-glutamate ligase [Candidatus Neomarinimicrobiota bacterium]